MEKWIKIGAVVLGALTISLVGISFAEHVMSSNSLSLYGDLRDYYPFGLWIKASKLTQQPDTWLELENDTYVAQAIKGEQALTFTPINSEYNWTKTMIKESWVWVQQDDPKSEFMKKHKPEYILWVPDGNCYFIHMFYIDGIPEHFRLLPPLPITSVLLSIPWTLFISAIVITHKKTCINWKQSNNL